MAPREEPHAEPMRIPVEVGGVEAVSASWSPAADGARPLLLATGAGLAMESPFMRALATALVRQGFSVLRFQYAYRERALARGRNLPPDRADILEAVHRRALDTLIELSGEPRPLLAGKSLGARISTHLAAKQAPCRGLILFGYPLHPAGKPERLRSEHFPMICQPALFLQGTRDRLAEPELLRAELGRFGAPVQLLFVPHADHGFHVPRRSGTTDAEVLEQLATEADRWERVSFPAL